MLKGTLIGNLGRDAELKMIGGTQYAVFNVAHSERRTDINGQQQETTTWVRCLKRDANARLAPYLVKGKKVYVDGRLSLGSYVTQQGETRYELSIWVDSLEFMDSGAGQQQSAQQQPQQSYAQNLQQVYQQQPQQPQQANQGGWLKDMWQQAKALDAEGSQQQQKDDDDLPF